MSDEKKNVPKLRFPEFEGEWTSKQLSQILAFKNGLNFDRSQVGEGIKLISILDILNERPIHNQAIKQSVKSNEKIEKNYLVKNGDILFQRSSETREDSGKSNVYLDDIPATFGGFVIRGTKKGEINSLFLNSLLKTQKVRKQITSKAAGAQHYNIGQDNLAKVEILIPGSLEEQEKIASFLSTLDERITLLEEKLERMENLKKEFMQKIFHREIRFKDVDGLEYPESKYKKLKQLGKFVSGIAINQSIQGDKTQSIQIYKVSDMNLKTNQVFMTNANNTISKEKLQKLKMFSVSEPSIIFAKVGAAVFLERKRIALHEFVIDNNMMAYIPNNKKNLLFLYFLLNSINISKYAQVGALPSINKKDLENIVIELPIQDEQEKISDFMKAYEKIILVFKEQIEEEKNLKESLLLELIL